MLFCRQKPMNSFRKDPLTVTAEVRVVSLDPKGGGGGGKSGFCESHFNGLEGRVFQKPHTSISFYTAHDALGRCVFVTFTVTVS